MRRHNMVYREPQAFASHPAGPGLRLSLISERHLTWQMCTEFKVHCTKDIQPQYLSYSKYKFLRNSYNITDNITNYSIVEFCKPFMLKFGFQFFLVFPEVNQFQNIPPFIQFRVTVGLKRILVVTERKAAYTLYSLPVFCRPNTER